jgi:hypothetical protein
MSTIESNGHVDTDDMADLHEVVLTEHGDPQLSDDQTVNDALADVADLIQADDRVKGNVLARLQELAKGQPEGDGDADLINHAREAIKATGRFGKEDRTIEELPDLIEEDGTRWSFRELGDSDKLLVIASYSGRSTDPLEQIVTQDLNWSELATPDEVIGAMRSQLYRDPGAGDDEVRDALGYVRIQERFINPFVNLCLDTWEERSGYDATSKEDRQERRAVWEQLVSAEPDAVVHVADQLECLPDTIGHGMVQSVNRRAILRLGATTVDVATDVVAQVRSTGVARTLTLVGSRSGGGNPALRSLRKLIDADES